MFKRSKLLEITVDKKNFTSNRAESTILNKVSFDINKGDFISILGVSGVGKTTLLRIIAGLDSEYEGEIKFYKNDDGLGSISSFIFQEHRLIPWSKVEDNIGFALPKKMDKKLKKLKIEKVISMVGLQGYEKSWPKELSGGMAQRVSIARALVNDPAILLLDEPFASLDAFTKNDIQSQLKKIVTDNNITCVMVTHDFDEAIFLSNQLVVLGGSPATIKAKKSVFLNNQNDRVSLEFNDFRKWLNNEFFGKE